MNANKSELHQLLISLPHPLGIEEKFLENFSDKYTLYQCLDLPIIKDFVNVNIKEGKEVDEEYMRRISSKYNIDKQKLQDIAFVPKYEVHFIDLLEAICYRAFNIKLQEIRMK
jgi:hypothetical protein